ncbi:hypothetical protein GE061_003209 [Apolygus lucorum]|uniref:Uncharacterized protein n=1 Tax=Apolygus lucorum TaxID=248454 RepID=A0A8S9X3Y7_APOLU|nr:hypothetical protein GE061_003209 [Apolygus lucorum]
MDLNQTRSTMNVNEDVGAAVFMKKFAEKKKLLDEAQNLYYSLCASVEQSTTELTALKMEKFSLQGLLQESEIRVKVYEKWERGLRDEDERARTAIKEAEILKKEELAKRDSHNKAFIKKVVELAEDYGRFKGKCDKKNVADSYNDLKAADEKLSHEIDEVKAELEFEESENFVPFMSDDPADELTLQDITDLQKLLEYDIQAAELSNANLQSQTGQLSVLKAALQKEIESLTEIMEK